MREQMIVKFQSQQNYENIFESQQKTQKLCLEKQQESDSVKTKSKQDEYKQQQEIDKIECEIKKIQAKKIIIETRIEELNIEEKNLKEQHDNDLKDAKSACNFEDFEDVKYSWRGKHTNRSYRPKAQVVGTITIANNTKDLISKCQNNKDEQKITLVEEEHNLKCNEEKLKDAKSELETLKNKMKRKSNK